MKKRLLRKPPSVVPKLQRSWPVVMTDTKMPSLPVNFSKHNIYSKISGSENYFIVNPLTGNADILSPLEWLKLNEFLAGNRSDPEFEQDLALKGYLISEKEEKELYQSKYLDFVDSRDQDEVQIFFVPNYSCNFACTYCYQDEYSNTQQSLSIAVIDAFFKYISIEFAGRRKYITVFGGEPLLNSPKQREMIGYLLDKASDQQLDVCVVTNGFFLEEYIGILTKARIREIQVTLDGTGEVHDKRRFLKGGGATFSKIVQGIDACLANNLPINLRIVADRENIGDLPDLARFAV